MKSNTVVKASGNTISITGELDFATVNALEKQLYPALSTAVKKNRGTSAIDIDLAGLSTFNSVILPVMLECKRQAQRNQQTCRFVNLPEKLNAMLALAGLEALVEKEIEKETEK